MTTKKNDNHKNEPAKSGQPRKSGSKPNGAKAEPTKKSPAAASSEAKPAKRQSSASADTNRANTKAKKSATAHECECSSGNACASDKTGKSKAKAAEKHSEQHSTKVTKTHESATKPKSHAQGHARAASKPRANGHAPARANSAQPARRQGSDAKRILVVLGLVAAAFVVSYNFAASMSQAGAAGNGQQIAGALSSGGAAAAAGGGGCCGGGGAPVEGAATVNGNVQKIAVDMSTGSFNPSVIKAKAGVPIEIEFSQAPGGCLSGVLFPDFGINEDLTAGPKTVKLPALDKGEYSFYCQMQMVSAKIVVE